MTISESNTEALTVNWLDAAKDKLDVLIKLAELLLKFPAGVGGLLLVAYAASEGFTYDLTSLTAIIGLVFVAISFAFVIAVGAGPFSSAAAAWA